ncbi:hypothetical protein ACLB2K_037912 [Fragaria x ananassa]
MDNCDDDDDDDFYEDDCDDDDVVDDVELKNWLLFVLKIYELDRQRLIDSQTGFQAFNRGFDERLDFRSLLLLAMELKKERLVRFYSDKKHHRDSIWDRTEPYRLEKSASRYKVASSSLLKSDNGLVGGRSRFAETFRIRHSKVFPEDHEPLRKRILDPDFFYLLHVIIKFRTAYVAPSSRVFGRGELVMDPKKIAQKYFTSDFSIDLIATLPLPQIVIWFIIPPQNAQTDNTNNALALIVLLQYIPRLYLIFPLSLQLIKATGVVTKTAWAGAAYNLLLYMLASHVLGAAWYLLSIDRYASCWKKFCRKDLSPIKCLPKYLDCNTVNQFDRETWANCTNYFYCLWWGLQQLSSYGQNLTTSTFIGETSFAILIAIVGLVLFAHLIGNMQTYLQSITVRLEEWRLRRRDTEEWMGHRQTTCTEVCPIQVAGDSRSC